MSALYTSLPITHFLILPANYDVKNNCKKLAKLSFCSHSQKYLFCSISLSLYSYIFAFNPLSILKTATNLVCFNTVFISKTVRFQTDSVFATSLFKQFIVQRVHSFFPQNSKKNNKVLIVVVQATTLNFFVSIEKRVSEVGFYCALDCDECRN